MYLNFRLSQPSGAVERPVRKKTKTSDTNFIPFDSICLPSDKSPGTLITIQWKSTYFYTPTVRTGAKYLYVSCNYNESFRIVDTTGFAFSV